MSISARLHELGIAMIWIEHDMQMVADLSDRLHVLEYGRSVAEGSADKVLKDPKVKAAFDARLKDEAFAKDPAARLRFFYERHPSYDARLNLVPVYRTQSQPGR